MRNKRGADFVITLLVVLGLAILVFVILAYVFGINVFDLFRRISPSKTNVDDMARNCQVWCSTQALNNFCCTEQSVIFKDGDKAAKTKCQADTRLRGDCDINCGLVSCATTAIEMTEAQFKAFCKENCDDTNTAKKKEYCCNSKTYLKDEAEKTSKCIEVYLGSDKNVFGLTGDAKINCDALANCDGVTC